MTHILITDLIEIRYMAYVPEEPKYCDDMFDAAVLCGDTVCWCDSQLKDYQSALEKAKRESIEFDRLEDRERVLKLVWGLNDKHPHQHVSFETFKDNPEPGIYQVPVEVEIVHKNHHGYLSCCRSESECSCGEKVARIVQPKDESQEDVVRDFFMEYNRLIQGGRPQYSAAMKLLDKFLITRKRG